ncbi:MAG: type II toxin-antitoxin system PemK/MazF family toxin [Propionibacteriales bacterium]|nr:type II toxin-antitoxin system PemK/MazF family toxin [Propionibacteriales bacterium]MPZ67445.1 type II toxin-antitoxin system PemK/MazF family toxin [Pseudonocardiaceae bacterium]
MVTLGEYRKPWVIVSNNARNSRLGSSLGVRITTSKKPELDSIVELTRDDGLTGRVLCDDITVIYHDELEELRGALTPATMMRINTGLQAALALR